MRTVHVSSLGREVSALGFGCASMGSRVSPSAGRRAVSQAIDHGVTWFDVAPPYGDGRAEDLLGEALAGRRHEVVICTKFGIARPDIDLVRRIARPLARQAVGLFPGLRTRISRARPVGTRGPIRPEAVEVSVTDSLRRLRTDYVDVLALHEPTLEEAADDSIHAAVGALVQKGYVRTVAIAGSPIAGIAAVRAGRPVNVLQFTDTPFQSYIAKLRADTMESSLFIVTHSVFGSGTLERVRALEPGRLRQLAELVRNQGLGGGDAAADALARFAFCNNPDGVVVTSMFSTTHIEQNCLIASRQPSDAYRKDLLEILQFQLE